MRNAVPFANDAIARVTARERERFAAKNPKSAALAADARRSLFGGVPMHWMADWPTPFPLFVAEANGARFRDVDGHEYIDFCLGDTGTMFGHSPKPVADAICEQAVRGYTTMLPGEDAVWVGDELARRFGLPFWQVAATALSTSASPAISSTAFRSTNRTSSTASRNDTASTCSSTTSISIRWTKRSDARSNSRSGCAATRSISLSGPIRDGTIFIRKFPA